MAEGSLRILVVDDDVDTTESLALLLSFSQYEVKTAHDGGGALKIAAEFRPHVVLQDLGLPDMSGYELGERLRKSLGTGTVLIVATGYGREEDRQLSQAAGFDHHLVKPLDLGMLRELLAAVKSRGAAEPSTDTGTA